MKRLRILSCLLLSLCMICALCACSFAIVNNNDADTESSTKAEKPSDTETETIPEDDNGLSNFKRLKRVVVTYGTKTIECNVSWTDEGCQFEVYDSPDEPIHTRVATFDVESKILSIARQRDEGTKINPVFQYDDQQKIVNIFDGKETTEVSYDENNVPLIDGSAMFEYDIETKLVSISYMGGSSSDGKSSRTYKQAVVDKYGNINSFSYVTYDYLHGEQVGMEEKPNKELFNYDDNGNLIRYEEPGSRNNLTIEFEYTDQPIEHLWERTIPLNYLSPFTQVRIPFLWYLS